MLSLRKRSLVCTHLDLSTFLFWFAEVRLAVRAKKDVSCASLGNVTDGSWQLIHINKGGTFIFHHAFMTLSSDGPGPLITSILHTFIAVVAPSLALSRIRRALTSFSLSTPMANSIARCRAAAFRRLAPADEFVLSSLKKITSHEFDWLVYTAAWMCRDGKGKVPS